MDDRLLTLDRPLRTGTIIDRPNRFVLSVQFEGDNPPASPADAELVHLGDPGVLPDVLAPGNEVLCAPVDDPNRVTAYDAIAVHTDSATVGVRARLANDLFDQVLARGGMSAFDPYTTVTREPPLPDHGRTDFRLETGDGETAYVEVKSCSLAREGVARFPDRSTARGRRHLRSLATIADGGTTCHVVFVVQRPDVAAFRPLREVDPAFADELARARAAGVHVRAIVTPFKAPTYRLQDTDLPVELAG